MDYGILVGIGGLALAALTYVMNRDKNNDVDAEWKGAISAKLDNIMCSVSGVKNDLERMEERMNSFGERVAKVESSTSQAHKRLDSIEGRYTK